MAPTKQITTAQAYGKPFFNQRLWSPVTFWTILFLKSILLLIQLKSNSKKKVAGCHIQKFPSLFFTTSPTQVTQPVLSCCILLWFCAAGKRHLLKNSFFSPHYCRLIRRQQTGQQLIRAQVRSQAHTLTDFPKPTDRCPSHCYWGLPWDLFLIHLGEGKSCRHTETITQQSSWLHGHNTN